MNLRNEVFEIYLKDIIPNRFQPREIFDEKALNELALSIKEHGVIQPIIVRKVGDKYEIIAGERRFRASMIAGKTTVPALIKDIDDREAAKIALLENLQRKNLTAIEEAKTYQTILNLDRITQEELATSLGISQPTIANKIRLLSLDESVQTALLNSSISERHARSLLNVPDKNKQKELVNKIIMNRMTVKDLDDEIAGITPQVQMQNIPPTQSPIASEQVTKPTEEMINKNIFDIIKESNQTMENQPDVSSMPINEARPVLQPIESQITNLNNNMQKMPTAANTQIVNEPKIEIPNVTIPEIHQNTPTIPYNNIEKVQQAPYVQPAMEDKPTYQTPTMPYNNIEKVQQAPQAPYVQPAMEDKPTYQTPTMPYGDIEKVPQAPYVQPAMEDKPTYQTPTMPYNNIEKVQQAPQTPYVQPAMEEEPRPSEIQPINPATADAYSRISKLYGDTTQPINPPYYNTQEDNKNNEPTANKNIYDLRFAINNVRQAVQNTEKFGFTINVDEFDFENVYQIIIKIDKK